MPSLIHLKRLFIKCKYTHFGLLESDSTNVKLFYCANCLNKIHKNDNSFFFRGALVVEN